MIESSEPLSYIRPYEHPQDFSQVADILTHNGSYSQFDHNLHTFEQTQRDWGKDSMLAHVRSDARRRAVTGFVRVIFMGPGEQKAIIGDLSVLPYEQGKGAGSRLLEAMKNVLYGRRCLPELLTNAPIPPEEIGTGLVDWYRARGFDGPYSAVGLIGKDMIRTQDLQVDPLYEAATIAADKIHDTLTTWGHSFTCSVDDNEIRGGYPDFFQQYVQKHYPGSEPALDRQNLLVGYPHEDFNSDSQELQKTSGLERC